MMVATLFPWARFLQFAQQYPIEPSHREQIEVLLSFDLPLPKARHMDDIGVGAVVPLRSEFTGTRDGSDHEAALDKPVLHHLVADFVQLSATRRSEIQQDSSRRPMLLRFHAGQRPEGTWLAVLDQVPNRSPEILWLL